MEWLRIDSTFPESPKVAKLARAIGVSRDSSDKTAHSSENGTAQDGGE